tara:strand:+ start:229 stop:402 length:174 start_codon:yes stop_codon:yes gene_type:complete
MEKSMTKSPRSVYLKIMIKNLLVKMGSRLEVRVMTGGRIVLILNGFGVNKQGDIIEF